MLFLKRIVEQESETMYYCTVKKKANEGMMTVRN